MERSVCIHAHFYQPPRENPWLEAIELQESAYPYHDWNERISAECYATNAASRILDGEARILQIVNNYSKISFNFGPTLLSWMQEYAPDIYDAVLEADRESIKLFSGHGSALAQAYNHMILPLAIGRDKYTQILWGIHDFEHRFGRKPEGMWLPETAVDLESLDILAEQGIRFTILAPHQARRVRAIRGRKWRDVTDGKIDPRMPYRQTLPSGRRMVIFFYDGPIARAVAFEGLLNRGDMLAKRLKDAFSEKVQSSQIVHIATDGESYGHHHRHGDMALAYALHYIESNNLARLTNYGEYVEKHPPTQEVEIIENSSWSCAHGVERWRNDCGCNSGGQPGWGQGWRRPLRESLDWLRDTLHPAYEEKARSYFENPWRARDDYIHIILDRSPERLKDFLSRHAGRNLERGDRITVLRLLEMQRHAMLMYTSCGWFFDELSGIETVQIMQYAARALQVYEEVFGETLEAQFLQRLEVAKSNMTEHQDGRVIYEKFVKPAMVDLAKVGAHYAMNSLFEEYGEKENVSCYRVDRRMYEISEVGKAKLAIGRLRVSSEVTLESGNFCFGILHWGGHNISGCVRKCKGEEPDREVVQGIMNVFARADFPETLQLLENTFGPASYSLRNLFRDEQRKIVNIILQATLADTEGIYRQVYENSAPLLRFLKDLGTSRPPALCMAADFVLNTSLRRAFEEESLDVDAVRTLLENAMLEGVSLDSGSLEIVIRRRLEGMSEHILAGKNELAPLQEMDMTLDLIQSLPFEINIRQAQNRYYAVLLGIYPQIQQRQVAGDKEAEEWVRHFKSLGQKLSVRVD